MLLEEVLECGALPWDIIAHNHVMGMDGRGIKAETHTQWEQ